MTRGSNNEMKTRPLGPNGPAVGMIGFGGMPLSIAGRPDEAVAIGVIHAALDAGATVLDTADAYCLNHKDVGHNERLFAKALGQWSGDRDGIIVATKGGSIRPDGGWERDGRPAHLRKACEQSLRALRVSCIDLYQLHAPDPTVDLRDSLEEFARLKEEGKIQRVGLSNVSVEQIELARDIVEITTVQNRLNPFFGEKPHAGVVEFCAKEGLGFLAYSPVGGGRLNKKLPGHPVVQPIADRHGVSPHAVVIAWVAAQGATVIPIPGARTVEHAVDAIGAHAVALTPEDLAAIDGGEFSTARD